MRTAWTVLGVALLISAAGWAAETGGEAPAAAPLELEIALEQAPSCSMSPAGALAPGAEPQPQRDWDPATCAACSGHCSSSNDCFGLKIGDFCNNNGGVCKAFDGCALFNCCRCANAL